MGELATGLPVLEPQTTEDTSTGGNRWMVVIYNNETNSMEEVLAVLMVATGCNIDEAYMEMWEAHTYGKASCHFSSDREECERVAATISCIGVHTEVAREWED